jgi:hypothetical protein
MSLTSSVCIVVCTDLYDVKKGSIKWKPAPDVVCSKAPPFKNQSLKYLKKWKLIITKN